MLMTCLHGCYVLDCSEQGSGSGNLDLILSMIVYGLAFDFFNISGALFVNQETDTSIRSSAQGLFMIMTNGFGATIGSLAAGAVVSRVVPDPANSPLVGIVRGLYLPLIL